MDPLYFSVSKGAESLTAIISENTPQDMADLKRKTGAFFVPSRRVELCYSDYKTLNRTNITLLSGRSACVQGEKIEFIPSKGDKKVLREGMIGYEAGLAKLGPELKKQIPREWYKDIGDWLDAEQPQDAQEVGSNKIEF